MNQNKKAWTWKKSSFTKKLAYDHTENPWYNFTLKE